MRKRTWLIPVIALSIVWIGLQGDLDPSPACRVAKASADAAARGSSKPLRKAIVIGIDGLSGDGFHRSAFVADAAPALRRLALQGQYTVCESLDDERCALAHDGPNVDETIQWRTSSGWLSVITGVESTKHGVASNDHKEIYARTRGRYPTLFRILQEHGLTTAAGGVSPFISTPILHPFGALRIGLMPGIVDYENGMASGRPILDPSTLDFRHSPQELFARSDQNLAAWLTASIECGDADFIMPVFNDVDSAGHDHGYGDDPDYTAAISEVDRRVQTVLSAIEKRVRHLDEQWLVVVTSDHGGHTTPGGGGNHSRHPSDQRIPFIVSSIPPLPLAPLRTPVTHMDVFPTVLAWFGVPHGAVDGRVQGVQP